MHNKNEFFIYYQHRIYRNSFAFSNKRSTALPSSLTVPMADSYVFYRFTLSQMLNYDFKSKPKYEFFLLYIGIKKIYLSNSNLYRVFQKKSNYLHIYLPIDLSIYLSICYLFIYLSINHICVYPDETYIHGRVTVNNEITSALVQNPK